MSRFIVMMVTAVAVAALDKFCGPLSMGTAASLVIWAIAMASCEELD